MSKSMLSYEEVIKLAETDPDRKIWCISIDGRVDFMTTAKEIKDTAGNFDWTGVSFGYIKDSDEKGQDNQEEIKCSELTISRKRYINKIQLFKSSGIMDLSALVNEFIENKQIVSIQYQTSSSSYKESIITEYSVMIHYVEEE